MFGAEDAWNKLQILVRLKLLFRAMPLLYCFPGLLYVLQMRPKNV